METMHVLFAKIQVQKAMELESFFLHFCLHFLLNTLQSHSFSVSFLVSRISYICVTVLKSGITYLKNVECGICKCPRHTFLRGSVQMEALGSSDLP